MENMSLNTFRNTMLCATCQLNLASSTPRSIICCKKRGHNHTVALVYQLIEKLKLTPTENCYRLATYKFVMVVMLNCGVFSISCLTSIALMISSLPWQWSINDQKFAIFIIHQRSFYARYPSFTAKILPHFLKDAKRQLLNIQQELHTKLLERVKHFNYFNGLVTRAPVPKVNYGRWE